MKKKKKHPVPKRRIDPNSSLDLYGIYKALEALERTGYLAATIARQLADSVELLRQQLPTELERTTDNVFDLDDDIPF